MKIISRSLLLGALALILLSSACNMPAQTTAPVGTVLPNGLTQSALPTATVSMATGVSTTLTPAIPITGENVVQMQCQFCVNDRPHAILIFPDFAIFVVDTTTANPVTCLTAEVLNGKRVLVCTGTQLTTFNLKICSDQSNCLLYPVALQGCPLVAGQGTPVTTGTPITPVFLTAINTLRPPGGGSNPNVPTATQTPMPPASSTAGHPTPTLAPPTPTSYP